MSDMITAEEAGKLLDGTTPGPWRAVGSDICVGLGLRLRRLLKAWRTWDDAGNETTTANAALSAKAPDLARTVIALHAQLADAKAAQAMVVEYFAAIERLAVSASIASCTCNIKTPNISFHAANCRYVTLQYIIAQCEDFRALADTDGLALVQALRAERDEMRAAVEGLIAVLDRNEKKGPIPDFEMMFCWLAAQNVRAAFRKIAPKGEAT